MSFHPFSLSTGLETPLSVPIGTKAMLIAHVEQMERTLGVRRVPIITAFAAPARSKTTSAFARWMPQVKYNAASYR